MESPLLYEDIAAQVTRLIEGGTFGPGDRVSSVRELARQMKVSVSTVLQAYRLLENRGLIEARPQSGYYVRARPGRRAPEMGKSKPDPAPTAPSLGRLMVKLVRDGRQPGMVQLGAALPAPDLVPTEKLNRALSAMARWHKALSNAYDLPPGCEALRVQVAQRALEAGCPLTPEEIVTTCGAQEAIMLAMRATCRPGDIIAVESPCFYGTLQTIESLGLKVLEIPSDPCTGLCLESLRELLEQNDIRAVLTVSNYNNPTGSCMPEGEKRALVELLAGRDIPLIEDDIYGDLSYGARRPGVCKAYDTKGLVLLCSSFSKTLAPGYRVGWIAPGRYQEDVQALKVITNIATPTLPQLAVADFLANGGYDHHLRRTRRIYQERSELMAEAVLEHFPPGTKVTHPQGGFVLWVELDESADTLELYDRAWAEKMDFVPGVAFSATARYGNFLRLCYSQWNDRIAQAVKRLGQLAGEGLEERTTYSAAGAGVGR